MISKLCRASSCVFFAPLCSCVISNSVCGAVVTSFSWWLQRLSVWLHPSPPPPTSPHPPSPRLLPQLPLVWMISPLLKWAGDVGFMRAIYGCVWGGNYSALSTQREAVLWRAEGCFWTSRFREITDHSTDWQATDCMCLGGSCSMGADGFRWSRRPAGCMCADRMASGPQNTVLQCCARIVPYFPSPCSVLNCDPSFVKDVFVWECLCGWVHPQPQFNLSSEGEKNK